MIPSWMCMPSFLKLRYSTQGLRDPSKLSITAPICKRTGQVGLRMETGRLSDRKWIPIDPGFGILGQIACNQLRRFSSSCVPQNRQSLFNFRSLFDPKDLSIVSRELLYRSTEQPQRKGS